VPIDDAVANKLLESALAGIDPDSLNPEDEEASEVARQVTEALTRRRYFWCAGSSDDGHPTCSWGSPWTAVRHGRGYRWPRVSIRVTSRWRELEARCLEVVDGQPVLELIEDGPEPLIRAAPAEAVEHGYGGRRLTLARVTPARHLS